MMSYLWAKQHASLLGITALKIRRRDQKLRERWVANPQCLREQRMRGLFEWVVTQAIARSAMVEVNLVRELDKRLQQIPAGRLTNDNEQEYKRLQGHAELDLLLALQYASFWAAYPGGSLGVQNAMRENPSFEGYLAIAVKALDYVKTQGLSWLCYERVNRLMTYQDYKCLWCGELMNPVANWQKGEKNVSVDHVNGNHEHPWPQNQQALHQKCNSEKALSHQDLMSDEMRQGWIAEYYKPISARERGIGGAKWFLNKHKGQFADLMHPLKGPYLQTVLAFDFGKTNGRAA